MKTTALSLSAKILAVTVILTVGNFTPITCSAESGDTLAHGFVHPPASARPWVYWFWLDGNITRAGITADLEAMARVGIGGVLIMEVAQGSPKGPVAFGSPQWRDLFKFMLAEAHRLGIEVNMNNDAGWCGSGGPWITPELAMQNLITSETFVQGPKRFEGALPQPPTMKDFYRDVAVLAFPTPAAEATTCAEPPKISTSVGNSNAAKEKSPLTLPKPEPDHPQWVQAEFPTPFAVRTVSLSMIGNSRFGVHGALQVSADGRAFKTVREFDGQPPMMVLNIPETTAKVFRVLFTRVLHPRLEKIKISAFELSPGVRIGDLAPKAAFISAQFTRDRNLFSSAAWPRVPPALTIPRDQIVDLSEKITAAGQLAWEVPDGNWTIVRVGHTPTGKTNHPAPDAGLGLECDKLSKQAAAAHFDGLMKRLIADAGSLAGKTLVATHIDSWEVGSQNWTPLMREEFRHRRGYDPQKYLPVITGRIVDSLEVSERFLWDLRRTVSELVCENYGGELRRLANQHGLRLSIEGYFGCPCDEIAYGGQADEPMAEFWVGGVGGAYSCHEMASAAHVYGKRIVGAESFTATDKERWQSHPANLKDLGDRSFCDGINRFVVHRYALQPWPDRRPGMTMGPWGTHYERTQTWWEQSRPWHEYLTRCQFMLRQGLFVADVCCMEAEGTIRFEPPTSVRPAGSVERPGYNFDGCPPDVVLTRMTVRDGRLLLPDGMSYRVLLLPEVETMTPQLLRKINELVAAGATVVGPKPPKKSPSLADFPTCDATVKQLADDLWASGKIVSGKTPAEVLAARHVPPDFSSRNAHGEQNLRFTHRAIGPTDLYFVANRNSQPEDALCSFRVTGKRPELWQPETGRIAPVAAFVEADGVTRLPLRLGPHESVFVIFQPGTVQPSERIVSATHNGQELLHLNKPVPSGANTTGTFTMVAWVKPSADTTLPKEHNTGMVAARITRNDALYPPPGHEAWSTADVGTGFAAGRNGVCVLEHGAAFFTAPLVYAAPLTNWTHVAIVYRDGTPTLYLNGQQTRTGLKSSRVVHCGVGVAHRRSVTPFVGECSGMQAFDRALTEAELAKLAQMSPATGYNESLPALDLAHGLISQPGDYALKTADGRTREFTVVLPPPQEISGPWQVSFDPLWGGPAQPLNFDMLKDWSKLSENGIRYYSGTAVYRKNFDLAPSAIHNSHFLDLGKVAVIAEVKLNGRDLGVLWKTPFCVDVTDALKAGDNVLEIRVTNLWINRQIGDEQLGEDSDRNSNGTLKEWPAWLSQGKPSPTGRFTFSTWRLWKKNEPLVESGLLGPVVLRMAQELDPKGKDSP